jgi:hypothetical protein
LHHLLADQFITYIHTHTHTLTPPHTHTHTHRVTLTVAIMGAAGGLLVAATLKYADAILKTLASAGAIVIATLLGHYFLSGG